MRRAKAQSVSEYSICIVIILLALIAIQVYVKRGLQGRYFDVATYTTSRLARQGQNLETRDIGDYYINENFTVSQQTNINESKQPRGAQTTNIIQEQTTRTGTSTEGIGAYD